MHPWSLLVFSPQAASHGGVLDSRPSTVFTNLPAAHQTPDGCEVAAEKACIPAGMTPPLGQPASTPALDCSEPRLRARCAYGSEE